MEYNNLKLFVYTVNEYKRFASQLNRCEITDSYNDQTYIEINTKLMLLRKYGTTKENVYIKTIINNSIEKYPEHKEYLDNILKKYDDIEKQQLKYILSDGTELNLYNTIEDVMYGIYLHADEKRIKNLEKSDETLRFSCVRKYVQELESIVLNVYDFLKSQGEIIENNKKNKATVICLENNSENKHNINNSPYWSNLYGKDGTKQEIDDVINKVDNIDELNIILIAFLFTNELKKEKPSIALLDSLIFPETKKDWKDYSEAKNFYNSIDKPGLNMKVRFNENHTMAYMRIFPHVEDVFIINTPQVIQDIYEINFVKYKSEWKVYSIGGHLDSYIIE